jgi:hypothetical protein
VQRKVAVLAAPENAGVAMGPIDSRARIGECSKVDGHTTQSDEDHMESNDKSEVRRRINGDVHAGILLPLVEY